MVRAKRAGDPAFGTRLSRLIGEHGLTAAELSARSGISESYLSRILRGDVTNPTLDFVMRLASSLGVGLSDLIPSADGSPASRSPSMARSARDLPAWPEDTVGGQVERLLAEAHLDEDDEEVVAAAILAFTAQILTVVSTHQQRRLNESSHASPD